MKRQFVFSRRLGQIEFYYAIVFSLLLGNLGCDGFDADSTTPATTTPLPALLAVRHQRPIVVVACLRSVQHGFIGHVGEPILPRDTDNERPEIERLTRLMTTDLEQLIRQYPEQYLWMHDRWKVYK